MSWWLRHAENGPAVAPSLLAADFARLADELDSMDAAGADLFHLDVMDGHFVPNITFGPFVAAAIRRATALPLDAHLMISAPERYVDAFADSGVDAITVHVEADGDPAAALARIRERGLRAGLSLNPDTPVSDLAPHLAGLDLVLVMSVQPGFGGQSFRPEALAKIRELVELRRENGYGYVISVDGGIGGETAAACREEGAEILVSGSWLFRAPDRAAAIAALRGAEGQNRQ